MKTLKRCIDLFAATATLILLSPVLALIAVAIRLESPGPALYVDERVGLNGRSFRAYKFRSMVVGARQRGLGLEVARDDDRITRTGRFLRTWSLDELPQLINVVLGDMSLVGPRPTVPSQVARYTVAQRRRLAVRPGITGLAQVSGRNAIPWSRRIELDLYYVDHWSIRLDLHILWQTLAVVVRRTGLYGTDGVAHDLDG
jgi:lipopolysaccharide/colanic/teichoic acid biosynthesis glycosyltransferase